MSSASEKESWEDSCSSGSEYVPEHIDKNKRRTALYFHASESDSSDIEASKTTKKNQKRQSFESKTSTVKKRLYPEIGESSKVLSLTEHDANDLTQKRVDKVFRIVDYSATSNSDSGSSDKTPMKKIYRTRKRKRNPQAWKKNIRTENYQKGKEYLSAKGRIIPAKKTNTFHYFARDM
ncbi:hypothetical protein RN001_006709 [Aquatica leii]|uniref:Uncharacterized protein n=1 Tax=Aquatica leii TaxID=1421715 RepID=A0AAN7P8H9_9COLE|nr:hypothetical protein RN001_006709 [Aquatica leii]